MKFVLCSLGEKIRQDTAGRGFFFLYKRTSCFLKKIRPLGIVFIIKENWRGISTLHSLAPLLHLLPTFFSELEGENRMRKDDQANFQIRFLVSFSFFYLSSISIQTWNRYLEIRFWSNLVCPGFEKQICVTSVEKSDYFPGMRAVVNDPSSWRAMSKMR